MRRACLLAESTWCLVRGNKEVRGIRRRRESAALIGSLVDDEKAVPDAEEALRAGVDLCVQRAPEKAGAVRGAKGGCRVQGAWFGGPNVFFGYLL
jgi:hypothetical protein